MKLIASATFVLICILPVVARGTGRSSGIDFAGLDPTSKPGTDFFQYVNGGWIKANPIPADHSAWGIDEQLHEQNLIWLREIVEDLTKQHGNLPDNARKLRDLYLTATDASKLQKDGAEPLKDELKRIDKAESRDDLVELIAHHHLLGIDSAFSFGVSPDEKQSTRYAVYLSQGGLGLPERAYYVDDNDEELKHVRELYHEHVSKMFQLLGDAPDQAAGEADIVLAIETLLAQTSRTPVQLRDVEAQYNKKSLDDLKKLSPQVNWGLYLRTVGASDLSEVIVQQPEFFQKLGVILSSVPPARWRTYLRWHLIHQATPYLSECSARCQRGRSSLLPERTVP